MKFEIKGDRLWIDGRPVPFIESPNQGGRIEPTLILLHDTADRVQPLDSVRWFQNPGSKVSAHLVIGRDASIVQMVEFDRAAWHAGESTWRGRKGCNGFSIGIEIDNPGKLTPRGDSAVAWFGDTFPLSDCAKTDKGCTTHGAGAWLHYTEAQLALVEGINGALCEAYPTISDVAGHFEVSPGRKVDPGPHFPMGRMRGVLPRATVRATPWNVRQVQERLAELAYAVGDVDGIMGPRTRGALRTFQEQNGVPITGEIDLPTVTALKDPYAKEMPLGHRESITLEDVKADGSSSLRLASAVKFGSLLTAATAAGSSETSEVPVEVSIETLDPEAIITAGEKARNLGDRGFDLVHWLTTPRGISTLIVLIAAGAVWYFAKRVEWRRLEKAHLGLG